jgi:hypothetical protein
MGTATYPAPFSDEATSGSQREYRRRNHMPPVGAVEESEALSDRQPAWVNPTASLLWQHFAIRSYWDEKRRAHEARILESESLRRLVAARDARLRDDRLWVEDEAAEYLRMSPRWLRDSTVPKVLLPGTGSRSSVRYDPAEVKAWARMHLTHTLRRNEP